MNWLDLSKHKYVSPCVTLIRTRFPIAHTSTVPSCSSVKRNPDSEARRDPVLPGLEGRQSGME